MRVSGQLRLQIASAERCGAAGDAVRYFLYRSCLRAFCAVPYYVGLGSQLLTWPWRQRFRYLIVRSVRS